MFYSVASIATRGPPLKAVIQSDTFRSLQHRNYRLYFFGQAVSLQGTWMQNIAQAWLMYRLTDSAFMLGLASAAALIPVLLLGLWGGVLADRFDRRRLLLVCQSLALVHALVLALLTLKGWVAPWHILLLAVAIGVVHALEMPARHAFVAQLVPRSDLPNAVALNSSLFHLSRFAGPAVAGLLVAWIGEGWVFVINGFTFLAVIIALLMIVTQAEGDGHKQGAGRGVAAGLRYAWQERRIRFALTLVAMVSLLGTTSAVLMPLFARQVFVAGPEALGWLMAAIGLGSLFGALSLARRGTKVEGMSRRLRRAAFSASLVLLAFSYVPWFWLGLLILPFAGYFLTTAVASSNAYIQLLVPDAMRGRVMALFTVTLHGLMPLGQLTLGALADGFGPQFTVFLCGATLLITIMLLARDKANAEGSPA